MDPERAVAPKLGSVVSLMSEAMKTIPITYCGLEALCRVYEKINVLAEEEFEE